MLTLHSGGYPSSPEGRSAAPHTLRGFVFRRFDRVIAVNQAIADMFVRFGVKPKRIRLIAPHAVAGCPLDAKLPPELRDFYENHSPVLLTVGLLEPEYDLPLQMDVLESVRQTFPRAGLVIIGSGSLEDQLREQRGAKPYAEHILITGDVPNAATLVAIKECDVFLRTTLYDGDSVSVREALHFGVPVVASNNGMRPEGVTLFTISDQEGLKQAIDHHLRNATNPANSREARPTLENAQAVFQLYGELLQKNSPEDNYRR